jgi:hypothetical protein
MAWPSSGDEHGRWTGQRVSIFGAGYRRISVAFIRSPDGVTPSCCISVAMTKYCRNDCASPRAIWNTYQALSSRVCLDDHQEIRNVEHFDGNTRPLGPKARHLCVYLIANPADLSPPDYQRLGLVIPARFRAEDICRQRGVQP